jgi:hypothetical protein
MDIIEIKWEGIDCIYLAKDRITWWAENTVMNIGFRK